MTTLERLQERVNNSRAKFITTKGINTHKAVVYNNKVLADVREGRYLIKISKRLEDYYGSEQKYLHWDFDPSYGWFTLSIRREAMWFHLDEAVALINKTYKRFRIVERSKNGY